MSFSKGIKPGTVLSVEEGNFDTNRGETELEECAYPSCRHRRIARDQDAVFWDGVHIPADEFEFNLSPMAKLATIANPKIDFKGREWGHYYTTMALHAECAAEWGMHLIKDALQSHNVGVKLRQGISDALQK